MVTGRARDYEGVDEHDVDTGIASLDSVIQVNGIGTTPDSSGIFQVTVELETGSNLIEIISINLSGESVTEELVIFSQPE